MAKKKIYRSVISVEVLSDRPLNDVFLCNLNAVDYQITHGECSGKIEVLSMNQTLEGHDAVIAVIAQNSSPDFFQMDMEGNDIMESE